MAGETSGPTWRWVVGVLVAVVMAVLGNAVKTNAEEVRAAAQEAKAAVTVNSVQDVKIQALMTAAEERAKQLDRIEAKLDRLVGGAHK